METNILGNLPQFLAWPNAVTACTGTEATLSCRVLGNPIPAVTWEKDKLCLCSGGRFKLVENGDTFQLTIYDLTLEDGGQYICWAKNRIGEAFASVNMKVVGRQAGDLPKGFFEETFTVIEGNHVTISCLVTDEPKPDVIWRKNGRKINEGSRHVIYENRRRNFLKILYCKNSDNGLYTCNSTHLDGMSYGVIRVIVKELPVRFVKPLKIKIGLNKYHCFLECQVSRADAKVTWYKNNKEVRPCGKYNIISKSFYRQLFIGEVDLSDEATFTCDAIDDKTSCQLLVESQAISIVRGLSAVVVTEPSSACFEVELNIELMRAPRWALSGMLLKACADIEMQKEGTVHRLIFKKTISTMSGPVHFMAGKSRSISQLTVRERPLTVVKPIEDTQANENGTVSLCCEFAPSPKVVRWFKGPDLLHASCKYSMNQELTFAKLSIQGLKEEDSGEYRCQAGGSESKATLTVQERGVRITKHLSSVEVREEGHALFTLELNHADEEVQWLLNDTALLPGDVHEIEHRGTVHSLLLRRLPAKDSTVAVRAGKVTDTALLKIREKRATFLKPLKHMVGEEQGEIILKCEASNPKVFPVWRKGHTILSDDEKYTLLQFGKSLSLIIHNLSKGDAGEYCCEIGTDQTKSKVHVRDLNVVITKRLKTVEVKEGETSYFECILSHESTDDFSWTLNGQPVTSGGRFQISRKGKSYMMNIRDVTVADAGDVAFNMKHLWTKTMLFVKEKAVTVYRGIQNTRVTAGEDAEVTCEITKPEAKIKWLKDGAVIRESPKHRISQTENLVRLIIRNTTQKDSGEYCCEADGIATRAKLEVKDLDNIFDRDLQDTKAEEKSTVVLECRTRQPATEVTWLKGTAKLKAGGKYEMKQQGNHLFLIIKGLEKNDGDVYVCSVEAALSRAQVTVQCQNVVILEDIEDIECSEGDTVTFRCRICPSEYSDVKWYLGDIPREADDLNEIQMLPGGVHRLTIKTLTRRDSGTISFKAGNKRSYASLLVKERPPSITKELHDCQVMDGENLELSCRTSKSCQARWSKDGCLIWNSSKYRMSCLDNEAILMIFKVSEQDAGMYQFEVGSLSTRAQVTVQAVPVTSKEELQNLEVTEGGPVTLSSELSKPGATVKWRKGSELLESENKCHEKQAAPTGELVVRSFQPVGSGEYACSPEDQKTTSYLKAVPVTSKEELQNLEVTEGGPVTLSSELSKPGATVKWRKGSELLESENKCHEKQAAPTGELVVRSFQPVGSGEYACSPEDQKTTSYLIGNASPAPGVEVDEDTEPPSQSSSHDCPHPGPLTADSHSESGDKAKGTEKDQKTLETLPSELGGRQVNQVIHTQVKREEESVKEMDFFVSHHFNYLQIHTSSPARVISRKASKFGYTGETPSSQQSSILPTDWAPEDNRSPVRNARHFEKLLRYIVGQPQPKSPFSGWTFHWYSEVNTPNETHITARSVVKGDRCGQRGHTTTFCSLIKGYPEPQIVWPEGGGPLSPNVHADQTRCGACYSLTWNRPDSKDGGLWAFKVSSEAQLMLEGGSAEAKRTRILQLGKAPKRLSVYGVREDVRRHARTGTSLKRDLLSHPSHPMVARLSDSRCASRTLGLFSQLSSSQMPLAHLMLKGSASERELQVFINHVLDGLAQVHSMDIVHLNINFCQSVSMLQPIKEMQEAPNRETSLAKLQDIKIFCSSTSSTDVSSRLSEADAREMDLEDKEDIENINTSTVLSKAEENQDPSKFPNFPGLPPQFFPGLVLDGTPYLRCSEEKTPASQGCLLMESVIDETFHRSSQILYPLFPPQIVLQEEKNAKSHRRDDWPNLSGVLNEPLPESMKDNSEADSCRRRIQGSLKLTMLTEDSGSFKKEVSCSNQPKQKRRSFDEYPQCTSAKSGVKESGVEKEDASGFSFVHDGNEEIAIHAFHDRAEESDGERQIQDEFPLEDSSHINNKAPFSKFDEATMEDKLTEKMGENQAEDLVTDLACNHKWMIMPEVTSERLDEGDHTLVPGATIDEDTSVTKSPWLAEEKYAFGGQKNSKLREMSESLTTENSLEPTPRLPEMKMPLGALELPNSENLLFIKEHNSDQSDRGTQPPGDSACVYNARSGPTAHSESAQFSEFLSHCSLTQHKVVSKSYAEDKGKADASQEIFQRYGRSNYLSRSQYSPEIKHSEDDYRAADSPAEDSQNRWEGKRLAGLKVPLTDSEPLQVYHGQPKDITIKSEEEYKNLNVASLEKTLQDPSPHPTLWASKEVEKFENVEQVVPKKSLTGITDKILKCASVGVHKIVKTEGRDFLQRYASVPALKTTPPTGKPENSGLVHFFQRKSWRSQSAERQVQRQRDGTPPTSLTMKGKASLSRISERLRRPFLKEYKGEEPAFLEEITDQAVSFGQEVTLRCRISGQPAPEIEWYKETKKQTTNDQIGIEITNGEFPSLTIYSVKEQDLGRYRCVARNIIGQASTSCVVLLSDCSAPLVRTESAASMISASDVPAEHRTYSFTSEIKRGHFSVLKECVEDISGKRFAAKITPYVQEQLHVVLREYQLLKQLRHAHLVRLHDAFITPRYLVLIEELCAGRELLYNLSERILYAELHVRELLLQMLRAVEYLHCNRIVHLDLKSENMLVTDRNLLKIVDLGSGQNFTPGQPLFVENIREITESKAPEILKGQGVGPETDIWAVGLLAFIMLSADSPFHSEMYWERERNIRKGKIQFRRCYPGLTEDAISFMKRTLNNKPWGRPSSAECLELPWLAQPRRHNPVVCFSTDKLQAYLKNLEIKRRRSCSKMDELSFD